MKNRQTTGCDKLSRVYEDMFNALQEVMQDEDKIKNLSPLDYSALGLYIGKFVEQEINSSVVQIMRAFKGVPMPEFYCKRYFLRISPVETERQKIYLNSWKDVNDSFSLKTISLGDALCALEVLKTEDNKGFFDYYPWLNNQDFLDAWRELSKFRNKMAHIGEIIDEDILKRNIEVFQTFLSFMPDISKAKKELAPKWYQQPLKTNKKNEITIGFHAKKYEFRDKEKVSECKWICAESLEPPMPDDIKEYITKYKKRLYDQALNRRVKIFKQRKGKRGLKDHEGKTLVPPYYDEFVLLPKTLDDHQRKSVIAIRDGKYFIVALDGSGKELADTYDVIMYANKSINNSPYIYRKNGRAQWGFIDEWGKVMCDNIVDSYICSEDSITYDSNELRGYWCYTEPDTPILPPIFDDIEMIDNFNEPLVFVLNAVEGYVQIIGNKYKFISLAEFKNLDAAEREKILESCIREK